MSKSSQLRNKRKKLWWRAGDECQVHLKAEFKQMSKMQNINSENLTGIKQRYDQGENFVWSYKRSHQRTENRTAHTSSLAEQQTVFSCRAVKQTSMD